MSEVKHMEKWLYKHQNWRTKLTMTDWCDLQLVCINVKSGETQTLIYSVFKDCFKYVMICDLWTCEFAFLHCIVLHCALIKRKLNSHTYRHSQVNRSEQPLAVEFSTAMNYCVCLFSMVASGKPWVGPRLPLLCSFFGNSFLSSWLDNREKVVHQWDNAPSLCLF